MASVSSWHVIQVVIASVPQRSVLGAERFFIRTLRPVFNWQGASDRLAKQTFSSSMLIDDVVVRASKLLRRSHPRLSAAEWTSLISNVALAGERTLAAKLARHARLTGPGLSKLRAFPQVVIPCPVPTSLVKDLQGMIQTVLRHIPACVRTPQCAIQLAVGRVCWSKTPYADAVVAPTLLHHPCPTVPMWPYSSSVLCSWARLHSFMVLPFVLSTPKSASW